MGCGAEMTLIGVVEDDTFRLAHGFEHRTYMCSRCGDIERRFGFNKQSKERDTEVVLVLTPPPTAPASTIQNQRNTARGFLRRVLAKIRGQRSHMDFLP